MGYSKDVTVQLNSDTLQNNIIVEETSRFYLCTKRSIDIIASLMGIILTSPIYLVLWFFYRFGENKGPLIFKQKRLGKNGKLFYIYKFRSMVVNADEKLKKNKVLYQKYIKNNYKLKPEEDPRITNLGRFLRKTSIDEIPQLINVLQGKMSLVGPRPIVEEELKEYKDRKMEFLSVKPGLTGYWQICGRSNVGYPERVDLELYYVANKSFKLDFMILIQTFIAILRGRGAY
ncbi:sugar transferase [Heyndrickxia coagulans]|uniref:Undecaprenyl-phosphate galactosephosphotransferase n=1 Tax=Heyndrickxia coagulans TaxID=1398 RepID=A0A150K5C1_HEYCO|nr:sugar transferase [Heyndrickxia coagulans]KYC64646.1 Undecaprenyl-phosphate galactosephosphotransferase [Heyndrickxia coagulans]MED4343666.1 sugar transferase [Heyndrickxia coagulans]